MNTHIRNSDFYNHIHTHTHTYIHKYTQVCKGQTQQKIWIRSACMVVHSLIFNIYELTVTNTLLFITPK